MEFPEELLYTKDHEWAKYDEKKKIVTLGITDYAQSKLGDVVHIDLPDEGDEVRLEEPFGSVESVKAVEDIFAPVSGDIIEVNSILLDAPDVINEDPYGEGWIIKVKVLDNSFLDDLMSAESYQAYTESQDE
ncbi:MAG: glycine cleavage system protein GcvH [Bdellovibrionales bacterium]|nr:glycine cleavage system protein GcvH [Bdellovibrionales bacterium]